MLKMPSVKQGSEAHEPNKQGVISSIPSAQITVERKPFVQSEHNQTVSHTGMPSQHIRSEILNNVNTPPTGTPRANIAVSFEQPDGTTENGCAEEHQHQTVSTTTYGI